MKRFVIAAVLTLAACQSGVAPETTTTSTPTTQPPTTSTTLPDPGVGSAIYAFFEGYPVAPGPYLLALFRPVDDLAGALASLLAGVTEEESAMGLSTTIPAGTRLLGVEVSDGIASVDLSREFESGGGSLSMMGRVAQIVYTATRFEGIDSVRFLVEAEPLEVLGGEGLILDGPQIREAWTELIPPILVEQPLWGAAVGSRIEIAGIAELQSGSLSYVVVDADGLIIEEGEAATTPGQRSPFFVNATLDEIPHPGIGSLIVWEWAPDGSQQHVVEYPLTLEDRP